MSRPATRPPSGHTRWRVFGLLAIPSLLLSGGMLLATANGAMATSFAVSATSFKITADHLEGEGFSQYGSVDLDADDQIHPVAPVGIASAKIYNLCQSAVFDAGFGEMTIRISAGTDEPVEATNLVLDTDALSGDAEFSDIEIGRDASSMDTVPGHQGQAGMFGQQADTIVIDDVRQNNWATSAGTFTLNDLDMSVKAGRDECY
ncbi:MAG: DUF6230 family protein [Stackebrandtia sp.]